MKKMLPVLTLMTVVFLNLAGCDRDRPGEKKAVAKVNNYVILLDDFDTELAQELEMDPDYKLTMDAKQRFLDELVRKELLIQEARRRELDRKEEFVKTIERYWESTLIRDLMSSVSEEISKRSVVSEEEIDERYGQMKKSGDKRPLTDELRKDIRRELIGEKKTAFLEEWMKDLKRKADIKIYTENL